MKPHRQGVARQHAHRALAQEPQKEKGDKKRKQPRDLRHAETGDAKYKHHAHQRATRAVTIHQSADIGQRQRRQHRARHIGPAQLAI